MLAKTGYSSVNVLIYPEKNENISNVTNNKTFSFML